MIAALAAELANIQNEQVTLKARLAAIEHENALLEAQM
jgi:hypothetical protein